MHLEHIKNDDKHYLIFLSNTMALIDCIFSSLKFDLYKRFHSHLHILKGDSKV